MRQAHWWSHSRAAWLLCLGLLAVLSACGVQSHEETELAATGAAAESTASATLEPQAEPGITFPYIVQPACPGEGCAFGEWMACEVVPVYARLGDTTAIAFELADRERFEVETGAVVIRKPGLVVVTRPTPQSERQTNTTVFQPGDTLLVLDYVGEGFFNVFHRDTILETEVFWRWANFAAPDSVYRAEVLREGESVFWVRARRKGGQPGWLRTENARLAAAYSLLEEPLRCYEEAT